MENEAKCTTFLVKMMRMKNHPRIKGRIKLVLIQRPGGTQK